MRQILLFLMTITSIGLMAQAKKPTLMVVPSDVWCIQNGYYTNFDNQGTDQRVADYKKAFQSNTDILLAISKINAMMADRGFPLKNLESTLKSIEQRTAEDNMTSSKSGNDLTESPLDRLRRTAKADIILQLTWNVNKIGPKFSVTYNLQGIDAYTDKQIAGSSGTGAPSMAAEIPLLLEEAVIANMDNFTNRLQAHFDDLFTNGREATLAIRVFDNASVDLESEYEGKELAEVIDDWMYQNTVNHRYSKTDGSANYIEFEQVRVPLFDANGRAMDTETFIRSLRKFLSSEPYKIPSKVMTKGLGRGTLVIGEK